MCAFKLTQPNARSTRSFAQGAPRGGRVLYLAHEVMNTYFLKLILNKPLISQEVVTSELDATPSKCKPPLQLASL